MKAHLAGVAAVVALVLYMVGAIMTRGALVVITILVVVVVMVYALAYSAYKDWSAKHRGRAKRGGTK